MESTRFQWDDDGVSWTLSMFKQQINSSTHKFRIFIVTKNFIGENFQNFILKMIRFDGSYIENTCFFHELEIEIVINSTSHNNTDKPTFNR